MAKPVICNSDSKQPFFPDLSTLCARWAVPVTDLSEVTKPDRDHAYILPDNSVWILNFDGTGMIQLNAGGTGGQPTMVKNDDGYLIVTGNGTHDVTIDVNYEELMSDFYTKQETEDRIFDVVSGDSIKISGVLDFKGKVLNSVVENPHIAKWGGGATLQLPNSTTLTEFTQSRYNAINDLDGISATVQTTTNTSCVQVIRRWNLIAVIERDHPHLFGILGATTTAEKVAIARKFITSLEPSDWSFGSGSGAGETKNLIQFQLFNNVTKLWVGSQSTTATVPTKLSYSQGSSTNLNYISDDGFVDTISFAPASNGTIASIVNIDYTSLEYTFTISTSDIYALKSEVYSKSETDGFLNLKADKTVAQMNKITSDDGRPTATIQTGTILSSVLSRASGMKTYTFTNATTDYPTRAATSMRGYAYMASGSYGYVFAVDIAGNSFVRAIVDSAWVGDWKQVASFDEVGSKQNKLSAGANITIENDVISATGGGTIDAYTKSESDLRFAEIAKAQMLKLTADDGKAKSIGSLSYVPTNLAEIKETGTFYITSTEMTAFANETSLSSVNGSNFKGSGYLINVAGQSDVARYQIFARNTTAAIGNRILTRYVTSSTTSDWKELSDAMKTQNSKITSDAGNAFTTVTADTTLLDYALTTGGTKVLRATSSSISDLPGTSGVFNFLQMMTDSSNGLVLGIREGSSPEYYIRSIFNSAWRGEWMRIDNSPVKSEETVPVLEDNFQDYATSTGCIIRKKADGTCYVYGDIKNIEEIPTGSNLVKIGTVPSGFRPVREVRFVQPASGLNTYVLTISAIGGVMYLGYHQGTSGAAAVTAGSKLGLCCSWETI